MIKLQTPVDVGTSKFGISYEDKILSLGSCFSDNIGKKMSEAGFDICLNPFGTLYNAASVCNSIFRLAYSSPFTEEDCIEMGAGAGLYCSFSHHTSFARKTKEEFLENANRKLSEASLFFRQCNKIIITLGTSWVYKNIDNQDIVSNCLKRPAKEFSREMLNIHNTFVMLSGVVRRFSERQEDILPKKFIFTVSPIRHLSDGANGNQLSKSTLLLTENALCSAFPDSAEYFPAFEIMMDELRDYRFYANDMLHPSDLAINHIWDRFCDFALPENEKERLLANEKSFRQSQHRKMH